ncbi:MAG: TetR/AcrR family transcriptional regulator [Phreatobacter sp.]|uniref:TetR/AcrR family transcriptional regulator n=1 Tax=Phreatobacter sp. TaxID=1966341 RepID=UPI0027347981|nr:TetR/AcrR family transcriptional regulator [Phreatobacter sp.]MDP2802266.1 TetR/AcrR family transcriptional regulator [Phreatobacter sp.]
MTDTTGTDVTKDRHGAIVAAFMGLLAERDFDAVTLADIADRSGLSLGEIRAGFDTRFSIIEAFVAGIDRAVLDGIDADLADQDTKERLFDVLMRRLDLLTPHKAAIRNLSHAAMRDPALALALNGVARRSQRWMLAAAGVEVPGAGGMIRAQGLAIAFAKVVQAWLDDEDPALARTMRVLDEELVKAGRAAKTLKSIEQLTAPLKSLLCAPLSWRRGSSSRSRPNEDRDDRDRGWRGDDFRDPKVTPV